MKIETRMQHREASIELFVAGTQHYLVLDWIVVSHLVVVISIHLIVLRVSAASSFVFDRGKEQQRRGHGTYSRSDLARLTFCCITPCHIWDRYAQTDIKRRIHNATE